MLVRNRRPTCLTLGLLTMYTQFGEILDTSIAVTTPATGTDIVGNADLANTATFTFTPGTTFSVYGGKISLSGPNWFSSTKNL